MTALQVGTWTEVPGLVNNMGTAALRRNSVLALLADRAVWGWQIGPDELADIVRVHRAVRDASAAVRRFVGHVTANRAADPRIPTETRP